ncbi:MAG: hypothetical protein JXR03_11050 [Cyclobacteriaceae bacterium]
MNLLPFKPFVYFQLEKDSGGKKYKYHIHTLINIPDGFKLVPRDVEAGINGTTEIFFDVEQDPLMTYKEPTYFYQGIFDKDRRRNGSGTVTEKKFLVKVYVPEEFRGSFNLLASNTPQTNPDYDDADGYPI